MFLDFVVRGNVRRVVEYFFFFCSINIVQHIRRELPKSDRLLNWAARIRIILKRQVINKVLLNENVHMHAYESNKAPSVGYFN